MSRRATQNQLPDPATPLASRSKQVETSSFAPSISPATLLSEKHISSVAQHDETFQYLSRTSDLDLHPAVGGSNGIGREVKRSRGDLPQLGVVIGASTDRLSGDHPEETENYGNSADLSPRTKDLSLSVSPTAGTSLPLHGEKERARQSPRAKGSSSTNTPSPEELERRRRATIERDQKRASPLARRLGEDVPFMLPHPTRNDATSQAYPGVVIGAFAGGGSNTGLAFGMDGMRFDGSMDDILDPTATGFAQGRNDSTAGQAGASIAPWLVDDTDVFPEPQPALDEATIGVAPKESPRKASMQVLNHFASVPALPKAKRQGVGSLALDTHAGSSSRSGSHPSILPSSALSAFSSSVAPPNSSRSRLGSDDSIQTLGVPQQEKKASSPSREPPLLASQAARQSIAPGSSSGGRLSRFGSTVSSASGSGSAGGDKKKGFLGGLLKRKTGASMSTSQSVLSRVVQGLTTSSDPIMSDFAPSDGSRSESTDSHFSASTSAGSHSKKPAEDPRHSPERFAVRNGQSFYSDDAISPLHERDTSEYFRLDMDLDNMEGIVDPNVSTAQAPPPASFRGPAASVQITNAQSTVGFAALPGALDRTSSFATTVSSGSGSSGPAMKPLTSTPGRSVVSEAHRHLETNFIRNPFGTGPSSGPLDTKPRTPPSPNTISPKHSLPPNTQPRRPSQLRNVKMGSTDSAALSDLLDNASLEPLAPGWVSTAASGPTVFNDPFGPSTAYKSFDDSGIRSSRPSTSTALEAHVVPNDSTFRGPPGDGRVNSEGAAADGAAWAAPESWGVEGDEIPEDSSTTSEDEDEWKGDEVHSPLPLGEITSKDSSGARPLSSEAKQPPPFGFRSAQPGVPKSRSSVRPGSGNRTRVKTSNGRPSTAAGSVAGRPGTSGSASVSTLPVRKQVDIPGYGLLCVALHSYSPCRQDVQYPFVPTAHNYRGDNARIIRDD